MLFLKALASSISIGSGFRGGLFFASLYLGGLLGKCFCGVIAFYDPALAPDPWVCGIVGMAGLAAAILGGPLTMSFLALETTGNVLLSLVMLAVSALVSVIVRRSFGYSFATWRLHLRGESIRSAQDIGWIRDLTVGRLMRVDVQFCSPGIEIDDFKARFPLGATKWVVVKGDDGRYVGMISVVEAYLKQPQAASSPARLAALIRNKAQVLTPDMNIKTAAQIFEQSESEALVVVDDPAKKQVVGLLTEAHLLRRYAEELDTARRELAGERNL
jgi:CIC family chloride channel protein